MCPRRRAPLVTTLAVLLAAGLASPARPAPAVAPPIQLVETRPVESSLGNPALAAAAPVWVEMIDGATRTLDLEEFYLATWPGEPLSPVLEAMRRAAKRGVAVRLILDTGMLDSSPLPPDSLGLLAGVSLRLLDMKKVSGGGVQHSKYFIVDDREVYVGSQNLDWRSLKHIHELGVRARDPRIAGLFTRVFESDWQAAAPPDGAAAGTTPVAASAPLPALPIRLAQAPGDTVDVWPSFSPEGHIPDASLWDRDALVRLIDGARREIVVQSLTYGLGRPGRRDSTLDQALRRAAGRGVKVRLILSDWEADNPRIGDLQRLARVPGVEVKLSTVPEWSGGYIPYARVEHCKYMVVDTLWTWVGTSNWEPDYFDSSRNAALTMRDRPLALEAHAIFEIGWASGEVQPLSPDRTYQRKVHGETPPPGQAVYGK